jgi:hypothetical protein
MTWDSELAGLFKERNNKTFSGFVIGVVKSAKPLIISIEDGQALLDEDDLYSLLSLAGMAFEALTFDVPVLHSSVTNLQAKKDFKAVATAKSLAVGDMVALLPDKSEQQYLIIDRVKKGGI